MAFRNRQLLDVILYSNVFIGCCAGAQAALTYQLLAFPTRLDVMALVGLSTMVLYSIPQALAGTAARGNAKLRWTSRNRLTFLSMLGCAALLLLLLLGRLRIPVITGYVLAGAVALAYYAPLLGRRGRKEGLRSLYGAKVFYIALVWVLACVGIPVLVADVTGWPVPWGKTLYLALGMFVFVVAITIPFDIRDEQTDRGYGLRTLPVLIGAGRSRWLSGLLLAVHGVLVLVSGYGLTTRALLLLVSLYAMWLVLQAKAGKNDYFYFLVLDGLLVLQYVAAVIGGMLPL